MVAQLGKAVDEGLGTGGEAGNAMAKLGIVFAVIVLVEAIGVSVPAALFGMKLRGIKSAKELIGPPR